MPELEESIDEVLNAGESFEYYDDFVEACEDYEACQRALDEPALKDYAEEFGFDWHFAVAPLEVSRALGNLYSAQYLNPPVSPMLIIDRDGNVHTLEYGQKSAETLQESVEPYLTK